MDKCRNWYKYAMLSRYRHKYKTLHSRTKPLAILHEKKMKAITSFVFAQTPLRHYVFFFPIPLEVDTGLIQKSKQNHSPAAGPVQGHGDGVPFTRSLCGHRDFLSTFFPWIPFGYSLDRLEDGLAFDKGISFHRVPHIRRAQPTHGTWGSSNHTSVWVELTIVWRSDLWLEVTGLREKRNHILSISAENI